MRRQIAMNMQWDIDWHNLEVTKIYKNGKVQITETWLREEDGKPRKHVENYGIGEDEDGQYVYSLKYPNYKLYAAGANYEGQEETQETTEITVENKEDKEMAETKRANGAVEIVEIIVDGIRYTQTRPGYYYRKATDSNKQTRISKAEWEKAWDAYMEESESLAQAKAEEQELKDAETEAAFNGHHNVDTPKTDEKPKKTARRSKDVAFEMDGVTLTGKQVEFLKEMQKTNFWENGADSVLWIDVLVDEIGGQFAGKPMTIGAIVSTLKEKRIVIVAQEKVNGKKCKTLELTDLGKKIIGELN